MDRLGSRLSAAETVRKAETRIPYLVYSAIGNVVILAQRLSAEAKTGQILLSQRVHAAVEGDVEAESVGELNLKGISRPVPAVNVTALRAVPA